MSDENPSQQIPTTGPLTQEQAQAELRRVMTDASHPHFEGYQRGWTTTNDYLDSVYRRVAGNEKPADVGWGVAAPPANADDDKAFQSSVSEALKAREIDTAAVAAEWSKFGGREGDVVLTTLEDRVLAGLSPQAERDAHIRKAEFWSDMRRLRTEAASQDAGEAGGPVAPEAFDTALSEARAAHGINLKTVEEMADHLFAGPAGERLRERWESYVDGFPPAMRLKAWIRAEQALMTLSQLYQRRD